jgi:hypothetical protein
MKIKEKKTKQIKKLKINKLLEIKNTVVQKQNKQQLQLLQKLT